MTYDIEISRRTLTYRDDSGEWMDGGSVELSSEPTSVESYDPEDSEYGRQYGKTPIEWAYDVIRRTDATEPSSYPIGLTAGPHEWLHGYYTDPYTGHETETTVRMLGDWSEHARADVFRAVTDSN